VPAGVPGFVTCPRYAVNILEAGWGRHRDPRQLTYQAGLINCGDSGEEQLTFFADEWINPRRGIQVKDIRLKASTGFRNVDGHTAPENPLLLAAVSVIKKRIPPQPKPLGNDGL